MTAMSTISAEEFDRRFDEGEELEEYLDLDNPVVVRPNPQRRVNLNMPQWLIDGLDETAGHLAVSRQAVINIWLAERLEDERRKADLTA